MSDPARPDWLSPLTHLLSPSRVSIRLSDRMARSGDASIYRLLPSAVLFPSDPVQLAGILTLAARYRMHYTFRTAGTSLSGQSVTDGWLIDLTRGWDRISVEKNGLEVTVQPGITGEAVNRRLKPAGRKIGPDPASIQSAMMGGILANNASGMCCGVHQNAYHTLISLSAVLPDGRLFDSASGRIPADIAHGLLVIQRDVLSNPSLCDQIRKSYRIKNTLGYSLNAFLDAKNPADLLARLFIGSEGTLGAITSATLATVPEPVHRLTALFLTDSIGEAAGLVHQLGTLNPLAVELMDGSCLPVFGSVPYPWAAAFETAGRQQALILAEWGSDNQEELAALSGAIGGLYQPLILTADSMERHQIWKLRKGLFPSVGAARKAGTSVIIEDVAVPPDQFAPFNTRLRQLLDECGFDGAVLFGHARDGNLHFVISADFGSAAIVDRYRHLMERLVDLVLLHNGSLKAEHGTGRNMAPFLETAWGPDATRIMKRVKDLLDPQGLCNPGVIFSEDADIHLKHLKSIPSVDPIIDSCMECGFCEPVCPSRTLSLSPRQRIAVLRHSVLYPESEKELMREFQWSGLDTCATDGLCAPACPVGIDTGLMMKKLRNRHQSSWSRLAARLIQPRFRLAEQMVRNGVALLSNLQPAGPSGRPTRPLTGFDWQPGKRADPVTPNSPQVVWFQTCISSSVGGYPGRRPLAGVIPDLFSKAGIDLLIPDSAGFCCGMPFLSKGFASEGKHTWESAIRFLFTASQNGRLPVFCENSPCAHTLQTIPAGADPVVISMHEQMKIMGSETAIRDILLPRLNVQPLTSPVYIHPVCSVQKSGTVPVLSEVASRLAPVVNDLTVPGCCGMAGDRGILVPDLPASAQASMAREVTAAGNPPVFSTSRTCELSLSSTLNQPVFSVWHLLEEVVK